MWENILRSYTDNPRDVKSVPLTNKKALWFYVYVENGKLYVDCAKENQPSSKLTKRRMLSSSRETCDIMYDIYKRRKSGQAVSKEATGITVNSIYWYGIFADMNL